LIYEVEGNDVRLSGEFDSTYVDSLAWSPDGNWIVYNNGNDIFLFSPNDGISKLVTTLVSADLKILGWISVP
jgi:tricorn protease-like protein